MVPATNDPIAAVVSAAAPRPERAILLPSKAVTMVTAARELETVRQAMRQGVDLYLVKPFIRAAFLDRMRQYLARRIEVQRLGRWLDQDEVDQLMQHRPRTVLPKGLSALTLRLVTDALKDCHSDLSAQEVGDRAGLSRVSTRRYLEQLVSIGKADVQPRYGMANRPAHGYRLTAP